eukprot:5787766-Amphidinium_carterae.5
MHDIEQGEADEDDDRETSATSQAPATKSKSRGRKGYVHGEREPDTMRLMITTLITIQLCRHLRQRVELYHMTSCPHALFVWLKPTRLQKGALRHT